MPEFMLGGSTALDPKVKYRIAEYINLHLGGGDGQILMLTPDPAQGLGIRPSKRIRLGSSRARWRSISGFSGQESRTPSLFSILFMPSYQ